VPEVPEPVVPVALLLPALPSVVPLEVAPEDELPEALLSELLPVELHAARLIAIRPAINAVWYVFTIFSFLMWWMPSSWGWVWVLEIG
jgi:hypothetical protein